MLTIKKLSLIALSSAFTLSLTGCDSDDLIEQVTGGFAINAGNVDSVIQRGIITPRLLTENLIEISNDAHFASSLLEGVEENAVVQACDEGTFTVASADGSSLTITYDNCTFGDDIKNGVISVQQAFHSGAANYFDTLEDWEMTQVLSLTDFEHTQAGSISGVVNGEFTVDTSFDLDNQNYFVGLVSPEISFDVTDTDGSEHSYVFDSVSHTISQDLADDISEIGLEFEAVHSEIGDIEIATDELLSFESDLIQSGGIDFSAGDAKIELDAIGNDNVQITVDSVVEITLPNTTWSDLFGD